MKFKPILKKILLWSWMALKSLFSPFKASPWLLVIPLAVLEIAYISIIQYKHGFALNDHILISAILQKLSFDIFLYLSSIMLLKFIFRIDLPAVIFMIIYLFLIGQDMTVYFFGNTLFEDHFLNLISWYSIGGFVNIYSVLMLFVFLSASLGGYLLFRKAKKSFRFTDIFRYAIFASLIMLINPTEIFIYKSEEHTGKFKGNEDKNVHYILRCKNQQIRYASKNSLVNFIDEVFLKGGKSKYNLLDSPDSLKKAVKQFNLPIGKRNYEKLPVEPFSKIVLFASESMSLDFFKRYNDKIPVDTKTSFYENDEVASHMMTNYFSAASPTLQALTSTLNSHPNYDLILSGYTQNSLPNILKKQGYETIFLRSASKYYAGENIIFQKFGFNQIIAREYFSQFPGNDEYIYDWGVSDRIMLGKLVDLLEEYKDKKLFVVILGIDTHPPHGRAEYGFRTTKYPDTPQNYSEFKSASRWMESVFNHDHDIALTMKEIKEKGLYTDDTLFIATADHSCPYNNVVKKIPGIKNTNLGRTPLALLTTAKLPEYDLRILSGQLDLAPTLLHLLNLDIPEGYWGESFFSKIKKPQFIGYSRGIIHYRTDDKKIRFKKNSKSKKYRYFIKAFNSIVLHKSKPKNK